MGGGTYKASTRHNPLDVLYIRCVCPCADHRPGNPIIPRSKDVGGTPQAKIDVVSTRAGSYHNVILVEIYVLPHNASVNGHGWLFAMNKIQWKNKMKEGGALTTAAGNPAHPNEGRHVFSATWRASQLTDKSGGGGVGDVQRGRRRSSACSGSPWALESQQSFKQSPRLLQGGLSTTYRFSRAAASQIWRRSSGGRSGKRWNCVATAVSCFSSGPSCVTAASRLSSSRGSSWGARPSTEVYISRHVFMSCCCRKMSPPQVQLGHVRRPILETATSLLLFLGSVYVK